MQLVAVVEVADVERAREVLPQEVRGAALQRPPVAHQPLDRVGLDRAGEALGGAFAAPQQGNNTLTVSMKINAFVQEAELNAPSTPAGAEGQ